MNKIFTLIVPVDNVMKSPCSTELLQRYVISDHECYITLLLSFHPYDVDRRN